MSVTEPVMPKPLGTYPRLDEYLQVSAESGVSDDVFEAIVQSRDRGSAKFISLADLIRLLEYLNVDPREFGLSLRALTRTLKSSYGSRIRSLRVGKGWTQKKLADEAKIPLPTLVQYETDRRRLPLGTAKKLATALGVDLSVFEDVDAGED